MEKNKYLMMIFGMICISTIIAQNNVSALLPIPQNIKQYSEKKCFEINTATIGRTDSTIPLSLYKELERVFYYRTGKSIKENGNSKIELVICKKKSPQEYTIDITQNRLLLEGGSEVGIFYAIKTLDQILLGDINNSSNGKIAPIHIDDAPRYEYRAVMLDPARHFLPVDDVKMFIDLISQYKYNVLQLHLTDDQGWRIEIKSHPNLTRIGASRGANDSVISSNDPENGFYTQEQMKEIIDYAAERYIEIVPELDIPGHSVAVLATYPKLGCPFKQTNLKELGGTTNMMLCAASEDVYTVYEDIIQEIAMLFPSEKIHLGGDEVAIEDNWAKCDKCLNLMRKAGYHEASQLMNIFFGRIFDIVNRNGKKAILWCELDNILLPANNYLFPYPKDVTLVSWRSGLTPKCIELTRVHGNSLIIAPGEYAYLDYPQWQNDLPEFNNWGMPITTLQKSYELDPGYALPYDEQSHIIGVMATMWGEAIKDINRLNYMFFPRGLAIAEAGWSLMELRDWESFKQRLYPNLSDLMKRGVSFRVPFEIVNK